MTLRLVALMSVVLLLSLAAVGLLVQHYQQQFMEEVQTTAADVGQAALRTLEWTGGANLHVGSAVLRWGPHPGDADAESGEATFEEVHDVVVMRTGADEVSHRRIKHLITTSTEDNEFTISERLVYPAGVLPHILPGEAFEQEFQACLQARIEKLDPADNRMFINVEAVRAESDPTQGLVLKIPGFKRTDGHEGQTPGDDEQQLRVEFRPLSAAAGTDVFVGRRDEIALPIGGNYEKLFSRLRTRSLSLFMGVFVVGLVLSTGLASRFTRPIRKLDAGIRKLSEGDLDVEVQVAGKGEIGRLSRAFNEMAAKLRANRARERDMVRREKLSALGRLAAGVAHDVRNPLHSIGLTLQHLSETSRPEGSENREQFDHSIDVIRGEIRRLDQLVGNFLQFARSERHERQPVELATLLEETVRLVQKEAERRGVSIDLEIGEGLHSVPADGEAIRSVILNLVLNSFEAMPEGGRLTLAAAAADGAMRLTVADTGHGIPEEEQEHVFDFAYTTRDSGHGLGLAMAHHTVVEEHGGAISLESRPGEGTRVQVTLPTDGNGS